MVSLGLIPVILIVQLIVTMFIIIAILLFLLKAKNKEILAVKNVSGTGSEYSAIASVEYYFNFEIKLIESRLNLQFTDEDLKKEEFGEADWLTLRKGLLEIEKELLTADSNLENYWVDVAEKFKKILSDCHLVKRILVKDIQDDDEDEQKEMKQLLKSQYNDFDSLFLELEGKKSEVEVGQLKEKLSSIIRNHTELSHCIYMLEEENLFLRNHVKGLL
ncbi:MAG: hypothetical protein OEY78_07010 [Gammaproteobacteria bacterium]|nr:hypothetical protein [Gammaproteobacteria bacterium]